MPNELPAARSPIGNRKSEIGNATLPQRKAFLLRVSPTVLEAVQRWADDDLRSLNGQIEFLLRRALADAGRARPKEASQVPARKQRDQA